ncbi:MAG: DNA polymerase III subunit beta [candidate division WS2 bacterium]|nr:DNA polymerase III subunit beta [Candidatus Psychracetigena formicireducens]
MKLIILRSHLKSGLDAVGRATVSNLNLPVLGNVLIKTISNQIKLSATNLEIAVTKAVYGKIIEDGSVTAPYVVLSNIVNNTTSERINLETKQNNLVIKTDNYEAKISGIGEGEFPIVPKVKESKEYLEIAASALKDSLERVVIAAGVSDLRPEISGVFFNLESSELKLAATDTFRLAEVKIYGSQIKNNFNKGVDIIIPLKTSQELIRAISNEESVGVYVDNNQVLFKTQDLEIVSRLIDGKFPDYSAIIPKDSDVKVLVAKEDLINSLKLTNSLGSRANEVKLKVDSKKVLEVYASDNALGENNCLVPAKITGDSIQIAFNWRYLLDGVKVLSGDQVLLGLNGEKKPAIISAPGDVSYFYILMPLNQ